MGLSNAPVKLCAVDMSPYELRFILPPSLIAINLEVYDGTNGDVEVAAEPSRGLDCDRSEVLEAIGQRPMRCP